MEKVIGRQFGEKQTEVVRKAPAEGRQLKESGGFRKGALVILSANTGEAGNKDKPRKQASTLPRYMQTDSLFNARERTVRNRTVLQALDLAQWRLERLERRGPRVGVNMTSLHDRGESESITLEQMNELADVLVRDTLNDLVQGGR